MCDHLSQPEQAGATAASSSSDSGRATFNGVAVALDDALDTVEHLNVAVDDLLEQPVRLLRGDLLSVRAWLNRLQQWARRSG